MALMIEGPIRGLGVDSSGNFNPAWCGYVPFSDFLSSCKPPTQEQFDNYVASLYGPNANPMAVANGVAQANTDIANNAPDLQTFMNNPTLSTIFGTSSPLSSESNWTNLAIWGIVAFGVVEMMK